MQVTVFLKDEELNINDVHYVSFERNFVVVSTNNTQTKHYFKLSTILRLVQVKEEK